MRLRSGDKHHLRKSSDREAQIRKAFVPLTGLICFRSEDFLRWCLSPERNLTHNLFFLFPIVLGINRRYLTTGRSGLPVLWVALLLPQIAHTAPPVSSQPFLSVSPVRQHAAPALILHFLLCSLLWNSLTSSLRSDSSLHFVRHDLQIYPGVQ